MRTLILIYLIMTIFTSPLKSQVFVYPGSEWHFDYKNFWIEGYVKISYVNDTIINDKTLHSLKKELFFYDFSQQEYGTVELGNEYIYSNEDTVFIYRHNQFYILYDFSAQPGDSWIVPETFSTQCDSVGLVVVVATGDTLINGESYRYIILQGDSESDWEISGKITERIGNIDGYMLPNPTCVIDFYEGGPLRCYFDNEVGLINIGISPACDYITGISGWYHEHQFKVYPNPCTNYIFLQGTIMPDKVVLLDINGLAIITHHRLQLPYSIDISGLKSGSYLLSIVVDNKKVSKVIVKH